MHVLVKLTIIVLLGLGILFQVLNWVIRIHIRNTILAQILNIISAGLWMNVGFIIILHYALHWL